MKRLPAHGIQGKIWKIIRVLALMLAFILFVVGLTLSLPYTHLRHLK